MAWTADHDAPSGIITVTYRGTTIGDDLRAASSTAIALGKIHGCWRFLIDVSETSVSVSSLELFNLPARQYLAEQADRGSRMAVLMGTTAKERDLAAFYQTVCLNRDWLVELFEDRDDARRWLLAA
jgi:hypothetical protein